MALRHELLAIAALAALFWAPARAEGDAEAGGGDQPIATASGPVEATISAEALQTDEQADGSTTRRWVAPTRLSAGDEVYYTIRVRNPGKDPVTDVVVTKRLPFGVRYKRGSAVGPACEVRFSVDGAATFAPDPQQGGTSSRAQRKAAAVDYTHVRWILSRPLAPGATALLRFRASFS